MAKKTPSDDAASVKPALDPVTEAARQLAKPIYEDGLQTGVREIGKGVETVAKAINTALMPVRGLVWGGEKIEEYLKVRLPEKLKGKSVDQLQPPALIVAGPVIEAMRYYGDEELMKDMFTNLLASSIDKEKSALAHPSFVETIKNLSPDEAKIMAFMKLAGRIPMLTVKGHMDGEGNKWIPLLRSFTQVGELAGCEHPELASNYLDNLIRLGLLEVPGSTFIAVDGAYDKIEKDAKLEELKSMTESKKLRFETERLQIRLTDLGSQFATVCIS